MGRRELAKQVNAADREHGSQRAADQREHQALGDELPEDAPAAGADRQAHRDLALSRGAADEQQAGDVRAHDQQHGANGDRDHAKGRAARGDDLFLDGFDHEAALTRRQWSGQGTRGRLRPHAFADGVGLVGGRGDGYAVLQAGDDASAQALRG